MGPDETATREELGLMVRFMFAKFQQHAVSLKMLHELLLSKGVVTGEELLAMAEELGATPETEKAKQAYQKIRDFAAIRNTAKQYLDPPPEYL